MCKILLSINPEHVENIFNGNKKYEYRKIKCKEKVVFYLKKEGGLCIIYLEKI